MTDETMDGAVPISENDARDTIRNIESGEGGRQVDYIPTIGDYVKIGWKMFPIWHIENGVCACIKGADCLNSGKHPRTRNGVKDATDNLDMLRAWWEAMPGCNWALACGSDTGVFVVDLDPGKGGYDSWDEYELHRMASGKDDVPITLRASTGGGGRHLFFKYPATNIANRVGWLAGVDVRSDGGYVVLPPSNHPSGGTYTWLNWGVEVGIAPDDMVSAIAADRSGLGQRPLGKTDDLLGGVPEGSRDETLFRLACRFRRELGDNRHAVEVLILEAAAQCTPPFPAAEALAKVEQAFRQDHSDGFSRRPQFDATKRGPSPLRLMPGGQFVMDEPEQIPSLWGASDRVLMAEGEGLMIAGPQGLGKTTIAQQFILARYGLRPANFLGLPVAQSVEKVLYLAIDRSRQAARSMRRMVTPDQRALLDERLLVWKGPTGVRFGEDSDEFADWVQSLDPGIDLVVVDSLKDLAVGLTKDEVGAALNSAWQELIARGIQLLVLHHERKASDGATRTPGLDHIYGSTWLTSGLGSVLQLVGTQGDPEVVLHHVKQPAEEVGPLTLVHNHMTGVTRLVEQLTVELVLMTAAPRALTVAQVAQEADVNEKAAQRKLKILVEKGMVRKVADSVMTSGGRTAATYAWVGPSEARF